jgi:uncharacterized protein
MKKILLIAVAVALVAVVGAVSQTARGAKHHVVFQLTEAEGDAWRVLEPHASNLQAAFAKDGGVEIEVVFYGPGLNMLRKTNTKYEVDLKKMVDAGVKLSACQNAMKVMKVTTEDLFPFASQVDSGIAELTRQQEAGWAYVH